MEAYDLEFEVIINNKEWKLTFPYHGGQTSFDTPSTIFGYYITDDDNNDLFIEEIRNIKKEDYIKDYYEFVEKFITLLKDEAEDILKEENISKEDELIISSMLEDLRSFINNNEPIIYSVEASS